MSDDDESQSAPNIAIAAWGVLGFAALLGSALYRLTPLAIEAARDYSLTGLQISVYVVWVIWMWYTEGYRAFQKQLCPRMVARAWHLGRNPKTLHVIFAPLFCMALFHATRKRLIISWVILVMIIGLVIGIKQIEQPWRGIIDGGVVVGLGWGLAVLLFLFGRALAGSEPKASPELPEP